MRSYIYSIHRVQLAHYYFTVYTYMEDTLLKTLNWRYATKQFDPQKKIPQAKLDVLFESLRLTPSSLGIQPWKFLVVTNPSLRQEIQTTAYGQSQVVDASHLIVFARQTNIDDAYIHRHIANTAKIRNVSIESLDGYRQAIARLVHGLSTQELASWATSQLYIALGFILETAALMQIDACPMEGFDKQKLDTTLHLPAKGLASVAMCPVGYRSTEDKYASSAKSRFSKAEVIEFVE